jgi:predicted RND superfamily exporter protein
MFVAIIINNGSNLIFGSISFLTNSVASIIQLAVAMDYSIFLIDAFTKEKEKGLPFKDALSNGIKTSISSILAGGIATAVGFALLALMKFSIGKDMGFVLAKGIVISVITVVFLMPALILRWYDKIQKFEHKSFIPSFTPFAKFIYKIRYFVIGFAILIIIPVYVSQSMNNFLYGNGSMGSAALHNDEQKINSKFDESNMILALVPNIDTVTEKELSDKLDDLSYVKSVTSLSKTLPQGIPQSILPKNLTSKLRTDNYARIILYVKTNDESASAFQASNEITDIVKAYYPSDSYVVGATPSTIDIKQTITEDYDFVDAISLLAIAIVIMLTFKSITIPIAAMIPIKIAILMNMALPYLTGKDLIFMGYLIVSSIQLGATVDYSILLSHNYLKLRKDHNKKETLLLTISHSMISVLTSGLILTFSGYAMFFVSSVSSISVMGELIGRGAFLSMFLVLALLPAIFSLLDPIIVKQQAILEKLKKKKKSNNIESKDIENIENKEDVVK